MLKTVFGIANPVKKVIIKTQCEVHKFINVQAVSLLKNEGYIKEHAFFAEYIAEINDGAVWADQDFKSTSHFYNPYKKKGLYGRKNAMQLGTEYYTKAIQLWKSGDKEKSMFYLGAALHIMHDMTIPQHANIRLLDNHKQYETYVKRTYQHILDFRAENRVYLLDTIEEYIKFNARVAMKVHKRFKNIMDDEERYYRVTRCALPLSERTSAGAMVMFYRDPRRRG